MDFLKRNLLFFIVFITGAAVLIIEVTAFRILAPYFGNTLYSTSSIIGVVLGALSLGYYIGGILADKYPKYSLFFFLIILAGIFSLFIQGLSKTLLVILGYSLGMRVGPLIASLFIFFIPSLILGMMSPFAIKLKSLEERGIGKISGSVFFWSTLGSIVGSFATGFFLIPFLGINIIVVSVGLLLLAIGIPGLILSSKKTNIKTFLNDSKLALFLTFVLAVGLSSIFLAKDFSSVIFQKDGFYSQIIVRDMEVENKMARVLQLDRAIEGGIFLESSELPFQYTRYYILYKILNPMAEKALFLGGGPYSIPGKLLSESNHIKIVDVVEIEPELYSLAKKYFGLKEDHRLFNHITDGRRFLYDTSKHYDFIFADVYYSISSIPPHFTTKEFFQLAKDRLEENGFFVMNIVGSLDEEVNQLIFSEIKTFKSVFSASYFFAVDSPNTTNIQNFIFLGFRNDNQRIDFSSKEILAHGNETIRNLPNQVIDIDGLDLSSAYFLTDNYAPIEYLSAKIIARLK